MFSRTKLFRISTGVGTCLAAGSLFKFFKSQEDEKSQSDPPEKSRRQICLDGYELKQVQILIRHGARTPLHIIKNVEQASYNKDFLTRDLPYTDYNLQVVDLEGGPKPDSAYDNHYAGRVLKGGAGFGILTTTGQEQSYTLGMLLKRQYIDEAGLIDDVFNPQQVYVRSSNIKRTIATARCVLAGMFGNQNLNKLSEPVNIHVGTSPNEPLVPQTGSCRVLRQINHAAMIHAGDSVGLREDRAVIEDLLGLVPTSKHRINFIDIRDDLIARQAHGHCIPVFLREHLDMVARNATKVMYYAFCGQQEAYREVACRLSAGPLVTLLMENIENAEENKPKMYIYACHDSTLVALLGGLEQFDQAWPPFAADVRFELYENKEKKRFVRLSYNGEDKIVKGATSELCPLEDFKKSVSPLIIDRKDYRQLCASNILEVIAKELLELEKDEVEDQEDQERSDTPAGM